MNSRAECSGNPWSQCPCHLQRATRHPPCPAQPNSAHSRPGFMPCTAGQPSEVVKVDDRDRVGIVKRDVGGVLRGIDSDRVRPCAVRRCPVSGHADRQPKVDPPYLPVDGRIDHRNAVVIGIGDQQVLAPEGHAGRMVADRDAACDCKRGQIDDGNGAGSHGARQDIRRRPGCRRSKAGNPSG